MLTSLNIENFRVFDSFKVEDLGQVNLFVGANNCGKTSILEAVELLASRESFQNTFNSLWRRSELFSYTRELEERELSVKNMFNGFKIETGSSFRISSSNDKEKLSILSKITSDDEKTNNGSFAKVIFEPEPNKKGFIQEYNLTGNLGVLYPEWDIRIKRELNPIQNANYIDLSSSDPHELGKLWSQFSLTKEEEEILDIIRIIEPAIERIGYAEEQYSTLGRSFGGIKIKLKNHDKPTFLGSLGDGFRHLFTIAVLATHSRNGILLVDEIDTGLHYSILEDIWKMLIKTAIRLDFQVFATTHSNDCVEGLAWLINKEPELCKNVRLHRIEKDMKTTTVYSPKDIAIAAENHLELR